MKELNIIEASNMPYNTEFKVKIDCYYKYDDACRMRDNTKLIAINTQGGIKFKEYSDIEKASQTLINAKFIPIQQPVSFMEAVSKEANEIRVELNHLHFASDAVGKLNIYMPIKEMFEMLNNLLSNCGIVMAIKEGDWYIEESEE